MATQATAGSGRLTDSYPMISQIVAVCQGLVLVVLGIYGFVLTGFDHFAGNIGHHVVQVSVNPLANVLNLGLGCYALFAARNQRAALGAARGLFLGNLLLFLYGAYSASNPDNSYLALNGYATGLHLFLALLAHW